MSMRVGLSGKRERRHPKASTMLKTELLPLLIREQYRWKGDIRGRFLHAVGGR
jgi:hypothetical protein